MSKPDKIQIEVINLEADKLKDGSKFIFLVDPQYGGYIPEIIDGFEALGIKDFVVLPISHHLFKAYEIVKEQE